MAMDEVTKRNFNALSEGLKQLRSCDSDQKLKIAQLEDIVCEMGIAMKEMRQELMILKAITGGTGPTAR